MLILRERGGIGKREREREREGGIGKRERERWGEMGEEANSTTQYD